MFLLDTNVVSELMHTSDVLRCLALIWTAKPAAAPGDPPHDRRASGGVVRRTDRADRGSSR